MAISPCPQTPNVQWSPALLLEGEPLEYGITRSTVECLPGLFATSHEALRAALFILATRPEAIGATAKRVGVSA